MEGGYYDCIPDEKTELWGVWLAYKLKFSCATITKDGVGSRSTFIIREGTFILREAE